jgi:hypothetical protein
MILKTTSDAAQPASEPKTRSRAAAHCHLGWDTSSGNRSIPSAFALKRVASSFFGTCWFAVVTEVIVAEFPFPFAGDGRWGKYQTL